MDYFFQIINTMCPVILKFCTLKLSWIFLFTTITTTTFLMIVYKNQKDELKKHIYEGYRIKDNSQFLEVNDNNSHNQLQNISENLPKKQEQIEKSATNVKCSEKVLVFVEENKISSIDRYKELLSDLKNDLEKIECDVKNLQTEINGLSKEREHLKTDILQHQENHQKLFHAFAKEITDKYHSQ